MKRVLTCLLVLAMSVSLLGGISALAEETSGSCGVNVNWSFDEQTGTLTISGSGAIDDYYYDKKPWEHLAQQVTALVVEPGIVDIGEYAFYGLTNMTQVSLPDGLVSIGNYAFAKCEALTRIDIPDSVWALGEGVLENCVALTDAKLPNGVARIPDVFFRYCAALKEFTIPDTVTSIGCGAFSVTGLTYIEIPGSVKVVDDGVFQNCVNLERIDICEGVQEFGIYVFEYCSQLKEIEFPASLQIMETTLQGNSSLEKITFRGNLPVGAERIHQDLPEEKKVTIYYPLNTKTWTEEVFSGYGENFTFVGYEPDDSLETVLATGTCGDDATWMLNDDYVLTVSGSGRIMNSLRECWKGYEKWIKKIVIQEGITEIGYSAFSGCVNLEEVSIPDTVTEIYRDAFENCDKLTYVKIPAGVKVISFDAFNSCDTLERVDIMGVGVKFDMGAFSECPVLKEVNMLGTLPPAEPDPTETQPNETSPTATEQKKNTDNDQSMALFVSVVISVAILAAGGAVTAVLIIRKRG